MENRSICLMNDSFPPAIDGVANAVVNYGTIIENSLGKATVVTPFYPDADDSRYPFEVIRYPSLDTTKLVGYRAGIPYSPEVMGRLEAGGYDLIHTHCPIASTMLARALRDRIHAPVVFTYHTKFDIDIANAVRSKMLQEEAAAILAANISACDEVWTVSRGAGENLRKLGYTGEFIVMPNGVDLPKGRVEDGLIAEVTQGVDLPESVPVFLFVGRMMWYKGLRIILDALAKLKAAGKDFRMVFVGGGGDREDVMRTSSELQLEDKVFFIEPIHDRDRIRAWYCRADLFLFPSTFDTNGLVVREAAACGLGSVLVRGSCAAEDVTEDRNAFLIEENADAMAEKLLQLLDRPEEMRRIGENAQQELYMSWEESVRNAYERYGIVIENYRSGHCPAHEKLTDEFFGRLAGSMDVLLAAEKRRAELGSEARRLKTELEEKKDELISGVEEKRKKLSELAESLYDRFL